MERNANNSLYLLALLVGAGLIGRFVYDRYDGAQEVIQWVFPAIMAVIFVIAIVVIIRRRQAEADDPDQV
mgnify:CR=1 FL=1